jgi:transposase-like protein
MIDGKLQKGERIPGRRGFKVDELSEEAREYVLRMFNKQMPYKDIAQIVTDVYHEKISPSSLCRFNRASKEQIELAAREFKTKREWLRAVIDVTSERPDVEMSKALMSIMEGECLEALTSIDMQQKLGDLPVDKFGLLVSRLARTNTSIERLRGEWMEKIKKVLSIAEKKATGEHSESAKSAPSIPIDESLKRTLTALQEKYKDMLPEALYDLGIVERPRHIQGLDPDTIKSIREEIYGILS